MNTTLKSGLFLTLLGASALANAQFSANLGWASEYHYRGIFQANSSANGGLDYENSGFFAGTWLADVKDGLEVDGYFGYRGEAGNFSYGIGYTGYFYTGDFDDTYQEINLGGGFGLLSVDVAVGQYDNFAGPTEDYTYYALTLEKNGFYGKYAGFAQDFDGEYIELGYGRTIADFDVSLHAVVANSDLIGESDETLIFSVGKSFDLE